MSALRSFRCEPGNHAVTIPVAADDPTVVPAGWQYLHASHIPGIRVEADAPYDGGIWYHDPNSERVVLVCPYHDLIRVDTNK